MAGSTEDSEADLQVGGAQSDDGQTFDGTHDGSEPGGFRTWPDAQVPYWQDPSANEIGDFCGYIGQGGNLDWSSQGGWQLPMGMDGWRNGSHVANHAGRPKRRFCTSYPDVSLCRRGSSCAFAHSREEICAPLLEIEEEQQEPAALTDEFFMNKYKMRWCPIGVQHEWHTCVYAHNYQDARRPVSIGYGARLCPYWSKKDTGAEYSQRCPLGLRCPYSHGAKEQLYHPHYFKTVVCRDLRGKACPRQKLCAFFHQRNERRPTPPDSVDYSQPLPSEALPQDWVSEFLSPPFLPEGSKQEGGKDGPMMQWSQNAGQMDQYGQMPCVFLWPMGAMTGQDGMQVGDASQSPTSAMGQNWVMPQVFAPMDSSGQQA
eukprot:TRINITY_DN236_c0_g1_i1.p1 TRINITY_DN236_c0_g1~~TRINITY_DN236_c0_g1_i1.p1  ORF type:complete len:372 (+),score=59.88 TRINITY_DN236_c0_g1_i1:39-1154(+)